jgi:hypothetical protein
MPCLQRLHLCELSTPLGQYMEPRFHQRFPGYVGHETLKVTGSYPLLFVMVYHFGLYVPYLFLPASGSLCLCLVTRLAHVLLLAAPIPLSPGTSPRSPFAVSRLQFDHKLANLDMAGAGSEMQLLGEGGEYAAASVRPCS